LNDLALKIAALGPKKDAELTIIRNGSPQTVKVTLGALPDDKQAQADADSQGSFLEGRDGMTLAPAADEVSQAYHEEIRPTADRRHRRALL
jgi:serine protease Do